MTTVEPTSIDLPAPAIPHVKRNYLAHMLDGGLYLGAMTMLDGNTVLPKMVDSLHGPTWLIALMPIIIPIGFLLPPLFTAHWIERLRRYKPLLLSTGVFQRLPYLLAALALFYLAPTKPWLALIAVAIAPLISGIIGGSTLVAWQQLLVKTIPANRRSSLFATRNVIAAVLGLLAGFVVKQVIEAHPGAEGYGRLHLYTFAILMVSYFSFFTVREAGEHVPPPDEHLGLWQNLKQVPDIIRNDRNLRYFLLSNIFCNGLFIFVPFLTIHTLAVCNRPEGDVGVLLGFQMAGAIFGNSIAGYMGNRFGNKAVLLLGRATIAIVALVAVFATNEILFNFIYFFFGFGFWAHRVGGMAFGLEICPAKRQSTYLGIMAFAGLPTLLLASAISTIIWTQSRNFTALAVLTFICVTIGVGFVFKLKEPRRSNHVA